VSVASSLLPTARAAGFGVSYSRAEDPRLRKLTTGGIGTVTAEFIVLDQVGILATGVIAVWLTQHTRESWRRWACIFGLLGQPFWFFAAWKAEQWGILAISTLYTYAWARGIWTYWLASERTGSAPNSGNS
jgi:hypothetical protein